VTTLVSVLALIAGAYLVAVLEGWVSTGRLRPGGPIVSAAALLGRESLVPRRPDRLFFEVAPPYCSSRRYWPSPCSRWRRASSSPTSPRARSS
jgi:hypothetical protein